MEEQQIDYDWWEDYDRYGDKPVSCNQCGWAGKVDDLEHHTFEDDRISVYYCPDCDSETELPD